MKGILQYVAGDTVLHRMNPLVKLALAMAVSLLVHKLSAVFAIVPLFGWMLRWGVDQVVDLLLLLGMALFAIRAADRMQVSP